MGNDARLEQIKRDFTKWPEAGIGVPTGAVNGFFVIEADTLKGHGVDGLAGIKQLEAAHGALPNTLMVESPSGSLHRYYRLPPSIKVNNRQDKSALASGVDVRGDGGMVIAPPSVRGDGVYRWLNDAAIAAAPLWLVLLVADPKQDDPEQAAYTLLALAWPRTGAGCHRAALVVGGFLARLGRTPDQVNDAVATMTAALTDRTKELCRTACAAAEAYADGKPSCGFPDLTKSFGQQVAEQVANWLGYNKTKHYDPGDTGPIALGFTKDGNYALRDRVRNIIVLASAGQLTSPQHLIAMAPSTFWIEQFRSKNNWINPFAAGEALIAACNQAGPFNPLRVRGRGIWREGDAIIINLGNPAPPTAKHHYVCFEPIQFDAVADFDTARLLRLLRLFPWKNEQDAMLLLGWLALAAICGVLDWRPHGFIYGPKETGKTTLHLLIKWLLTPLVVSTDGGSTEAGIRQTLGPDSQPVIIDEFESDHAGDNLRRVLRLMRSASSADSPLLRGTPEGRAMEFSLRTTFLVCAVNATGMSPADQSRILLLELVKHNNDPKIAQAIKDDEAYFRDLGPRWCGYMVSLAGLMMPALATFQRKMPVADRHHQQNFATLLAAAFIALERRAPNADEVGQWIASYAHTMERHAEDNARDNSTECLDHLRDHIYEHYPLSRWIATAMEDSNDQKIRSEDALNIVQAHGIAVKDVDGKTVIFIRNGSPNIDAIFQRTVWRERGWQRALRALDGAFTPSNPIWLGDQASSRVKVRGIAIPVTYFAADEPIMWAGGNADGPDF